MAKVQISAGSTAPPISAACARLLDLQAMRISRLEFAANSAMSISCVPESLVSVVSCTNDPRPSNVSVALCQGRGWSA